MQSQTLKCGDKLLGLEQPVVMGVLNVTPDSFFDGGRFNRMDACIAHAEKMIAEGAKVIDIGAVSTKPGAVPVTQSEEIQRLLPVLKELVKRFNDVIFSVDTYRSTIARVATEHGAGIINDISGGELDKEMFTTVAGLPAAYVLMHMKGTPASMQIKPQYEDVTSEILEYLSLRLKLLRESGVNNMMIDPGFGFGKTIRHNFTLLHNLDKFHALGLPLLVGISRKSMIYKLLNTSPEEALNGTSVLNTLALLKGANILRVHDVKEAVETIQIVNEYLQAGK